MIDANELQTGDIKTAREIISKMASLDYGDDSDYEDNLRLIAGAIAAEREACAKIADEAARHAADEKTCLDPLEFGPQLVFSGAITQSGKIGAAIRARGKE